MNKVIVEQGSTSMYGFIEPQTIQASGNSPYHVKSYLQTWMAKTNRDLHCV